MTLKIFKKYKNKFKIYKDNKNLQDNSFSN